MCTDSEKKQNYIDSLTDLIVEKEQELLEIPDDDYIEHFIARVINENIAEGLRRSKQLAELVL